MCEDGKVQLVGGGNEGTEMEGRVEMYYKLYSELKYLGTMDYIRTLLKTISLLCGKTLQQCLFSIPHLAMEHIQCF